MLLPLQRTEWQRIRTVGGQVRIHEGCHAENGLAMDIQPLVPLHLELS
jgi:hypothetical protein